MMSKLLKNDISGPLMDKCNIPFFTGTFPSILKIARDAHAQKKDPKLDVQTIFQYHYHTILKTYLKN